MPLQLAVPQPDGVVAEHVLFEGRDYLIGRARASDIVIEHPQVSRQHAILRAQSDNLWALSDASSTGCFDNGRAITSVTLRCAKTLHFGPVPCRLTPVDTRSQLRQDSQNVWRQQQLSRYHQLLNQSRDSLDLVQVARECLMQTLQCERAALILFDKHAGFQAGIGYEPWMDADGFTGSRTIIQRSIESGESLAIGHVQGDTALSARQSIIRYGIKAALCVPVKVDGDTIGVLYGDNTQGRVCFTEADTLFANSLAQFLSLRLLFHSIEHKISLVVNS